MPVPRTYDELKEAIGRAYPDMSKQLQRIARFALEQPDPLALDTVAAIAKAAHVQPSAMIRFANALGYSGFTEMQQVFRGHLVARSASYRVHIAEMRRNRTNGSDSASGVLHQFVSESIDELGHLEEVVAASQFRAEVPKVWSYLSIGEGVEYIEPSAPRKVRSS